MRLLSSGSVTSVQSSVFFLAAEVGLSLLETWEDEECLEILEEDISEDSFSVSEPDWVAVVLVLVLLVFDGCRARPERSAVWRGPSLVPPKTVTMRRRAGAFWRRGRKFTMRRMRA